MNFDFSEWTNFDCSSVTNMSEMFSECTSLYSMDISGLNLAKCADCSKMFNGDTNLKSFKLGNSNVGKDTTGLVFTEMFKGCTALETFDMAGFNQDYSAKTSFTINTQKMFENCSSLKTMNDLGRFYVKTPAFGSTINMRYMFLNCRSLEEVSVEGYPQTFSYAGNSETTGAAEGIFDGCTSLRALNMNFNLTNGKKFADAKTSNIYKDSPNFSYITINKNWISSTK